MSKKKVILAISVLVFIVGLIATLLLIRQRQELREEAAEQVTYSLSGNNLVIQYNGFQDAVLDVNVHYDDGTSQNFHEQYNQPIGTTTKTLQLKNVCVTWIQVHGTNYHYESECDSSPTNTPSATLTPTTPPGSTNTPTVSPTKTPTPTASPTVTPTRNPSHTPTNTPSASPSPTKTPTPSPTASATVTPTTPPGSTNTPTTTATATVSVTSTITPTDVLAQNSNTPTPTNSSIAAASPTGTGSTLPDAGTSTPMIFLSALGSLVVIGAFLLLIL